MKMTVVILYRARRQTSLCVCHTETHNERKIHDKIWRRKKKKTWIYATTQYKNTIWR